MSFAQTVALGAVAGFTIYLGLPLGRWQAVDDRARVALAMFSVGILAFIFVDVMQHALSIVHDALATRGLMRLLFVAQAAAAQTSFADLRAEVTCALERV